MRKYLFLILFLIVVLIFSLPIQAKDFTSGSWMVSVTEDPLTDEFNLFMANQHDYNNALAVRYRDNMLEVFLATDFLGDDSDVHFKKVLYRFDKRNLIEDYWGMGMKNKSLFFYGNDADTLAEFIEKMMIYNQVAIGYWPHNEKRKTIVYDLNGFTAAISPYLDEIGLEHLK